MPCSSKWQLHCHFIVNTFRFYIGCDLCTNWYHGECVGITEKEAKKMDVYICNDCKRAQEGSSEELYCICRTPYDESQWVDKSICLTIQEAALLNWSLIWKWKAGPLCCVCYTPIYKDFPVFSLSFFLSPSKCMLLPSEWLSCIGGNVVITVDLILQYVIESNVMKTAWLGLPLSAVVLCYRLEKHPLGWAVAATSSQSFYYCYLIRD